MSLQKIWNELFDPKRMKCLSCNCQIESSFGWIDILYEKGTENLCGKCKNKLEKLKGELCQCCGRELYRLNEEHYQDGKCLDCIRWGQNNQNFLDGNLSLFQYNDFMKDLISRIKYRGDYKLMEIFASFLKKEMIECYKNGEYVIVPIPLSDMRHFERGFNQAEAFGKVCGFNMTNVLTRIHSEKQSKKSRSARLRTEQVFRMELTDLVGKKVLLLDDIYTTGTTLQHASQVLKVQGGVKEVWSLTIARS
jgi:competence protein ComFC